MNIKDIIKCCFNYKVVVGIIATILLIALFGHRLLPFLPFLILLMCPFSMILMMAGMNHKRDKPESVFVCPECGLGYKDAEWAKKCAAWCKEHHSCNLEIIEHAINNK